jgi:hypothetical protein
MILQQHANGLADRWIVVNDEYLNMVSNGHFFPAFFLGFNLTDPHSHHRNRFPEIQPRCSNPLSARAVTLEAL